MNPIRGAVATSTSPELPPVELLGVSCDFLHFRASTASGSLKAMSAFYLNMIAINPKREELRSEPVRVLVDTGSELSWMPPDVLARTGIQPRRQRLVRMADGRTMERDIGF